MIQTLKIETLLISPDFQARRQINPEVVKDYETCLGDGIPLPPIAVVDTGEELIVVDGFHRVSAYKNQGRDRIDAAIEPGSKLDALKKAIGANSSHGLRRSIGDKVKAVEMALNQAELSKESDRKIAEICKVSHKFVGRVRASLGKQKSESKFARKTLPSKSTDVDTNPPAEIEGDYDPKEDALVSLAAENEELKDKLAIGYADGTPEEKAEAEQHIADMRTELHSARAEIRELKISRDTYMRENAELKKQCISNQRLIKRLNEQLDRQKQNDDEPLPF